MALTDEQIEAAITKGVRAGEISWLGYKQDEQGAYTLPALSKAHYQLSRAIEAAATAPLLARIAELKQAAVERTVHNNAVAEVQEKKIAELEACLLQAQNAAIDLAKQVRKEHEPGPVNLWDGTPAKYGIAPTDKQPALDAALELHKLPMPNCPKCVDNRQVWRNQVTGLLTCHRINCHTVIGGTT